MENMKEQKKPVRKNFSINGEIVEKMVVQEVIEDEYDENGRLIFHRYTKGCKDSYEYYKTKYYEYDEDGRLIRMTKIVDDDDDAFAEWYEYDEHGNLIYKNDSYFHEKWYEYDEHGNEVYYRDYDNLKRRTEHDYDENGRLVHSRGRNGEKWYEYDKQGNLISVRKKENDWGYDEQGNLISICKKENDSEYYNEDEYEYDERGNITYKYEDGWEEWNEYYENGVIKSSRRKTSIGTSIESLKYYDEDGNVVYHKYCENGSEEEYWYKYKFWENGTIKQRIRYRVVDEE